MTIKLPSIANDYKIYLPIKLIICRKQSANLFILRNAFPGPYNFIFSSPGPKALGEFIGRDSSWPLSVHLLTFKHEYLRDQQADQNQISS